MGRLLTRLGGGGGTGASSFPFFGPTLAVLGDSITANNSVNNPGTNGTVGYSNIGYSTWWNVFNGQRLYLPPTNNFGVSGDTILQVSARVASVIAARPSVCILLAGTNDLPNDAMPFATMKSNMLTLILKPLLDAGILVIVIPILPRTGLSTAQQRKRCAFNNWIRELGLGRSDLLAAANFPAGKNIIVSDPCSRLEDFSTGAPITSKFQDGLHPNGPGAYEIGQQLHLDCTRFIPPRYTSLVDFYDIYNADNPGGNLLFSGTTNYGLLQGTTGLKTTNSGVTPTGTVATGMQIFASNASSNLALVGSKENPRTDGPTSGERQILTATATNSGGTNEIATFGTSFNIANVATNDVIFGEVNYTLDAGPTNVTAVELLLIDNGNVNQNFLGSSGGGIIGQSGLLPHAGTIRTPIATVLSTSPQLSLYVRMHLDTTLGATGAYGKLYIGDMQCKKVA